MQMNFTKTIAIEEFIPGLHTCSICFLDSLLKKENPYKKQLEELRNANGRVTIDVHRDSKNYIFLVWFENHYPNLQAIDFDDFKVLFQVQGSYKEPCIDDEDDFSLPSIFIINALGKYRELINDGEMIIAYLMDVFLDQWNSSYNIEIKED